MLVGRAPKAYECGICYELYDEDKKKPVKFKTCKHIMCRSCVDQLRKEECSFCRTPFNRVRDLFEDKSHVELCLQFLSYIYNSSDRQNLKKAIRAKYTKLEATLDNIIRLRSEVVEYFDEAVNKIRDNQKYSTFSVIGKGVSTGLAFYGKTTPFGMICMGAISVLDLVVGIFQNESKKATFHKIEAVITDHDRLLATPLLKQLMDEFSKWQEMNEVQLMRGQGIRAEGLTQSNWGILEGALMKECVIGGAILQVGKDTLSNSLSEVTESVAMETQIITNAGTEGVGGATQASWFKETMDATKQNWKDGCQTIKDTGLSKMGKGIIGLSMFIELVFYINGMLAAEEMKDALIKQHDKVRESITELREFKSVLEKFK